MYNPKDYKKEPDKDIKATMDYKGEQIKKFQDSKQEGMRIFASGRDATEVVVAKMNQGLVENDDQLKDEILFWRDWFYANIYIEPNNDFYKSKNSPF